MEIPQILAYNVHVVCWTNIWSWRLLVKKYTSLHMYTCRSDATQFVKLQIAFYLICFIYGIHSYASSEMGTCMWFHSVEA